MNLKTIILTTLFIFCFAILFSQTLTPSVISSGGENITGNNLNYSYTIGQIAVPSFTNGNILTQGFQQPSDLKIIKNENQENSFNFQINIFPNPVVDILKISITAEFEISDIQIIVYDVLGKKVNIKPEKYISDNYSKISIPVDDLKSGQYNIQIMLNSMFSKSVKIVKIN